MGLRAASGWGRSSAGPEEDTMWRSGSARRRRHSALVEMVQAAERSGSYQEPWKDAPHIFELFADVGDVLRELQHDWRTALAGAIYVAIEIGDGDLKQDIVKAFAKVQRTHGGIRQILEANADHPAIASAMRKERALLSGFSGVLAGPPQAA